MQRDGSTFPEALRTLAGKAGVEIDERTTREDAREKRLREVLESAIAFYHAVLTGSKAGETALAYLQGRGFTDATIETYQLGWAPGRLGHDGPPAPGQARHPTARSSSRSASPAPPARPRASTTSSARGSCSRSATRTATPSGSAAGCSKGEGPKYLNSPATPLFDKSRTLYLIDKAKGPIRKSGQAVIVEGYTDALMAHQAGFENVVAQPGHGPHAGPGRAADPLRQPDRAGLRRRRGRREGRHVRGDGADGAHRPAPAAPTGRRARRRPRRPPARRQGPRRGRPRDAGGLGAGRPEGPAARRLPHRPPRGDASTSRPRRARSASSTPSCRPSGTSPTRSVATRRSSRSATSRASRSGVLRQVLDRRIAASAAAPRHGRRWRGGHPHHRGRRAGFARRPARRRHPARRHAGRGGAAAAPAARPGAAAARGRRARARPAAQRRSARELFRAIVLARAPDDQGVRPPFDLAALRERHHRRRGALAGPGRDRPVPEAAARSARRGGRRLLLDMELGQLRERSDFLRSRLRRGGARRRHRSHRPTASARSALSQ